VTFSTLLLIFLGGGAGSVVRYLVGLGLTRALGGGFPWGTFAVNALGCFVIGVLARLLAPVEAGGANARFLLITGFLGGFTTFSAFALDAASLYLAERPAAALAYVMGTLAATLAGVAIGLAVGQVLVGQALRG